MSYAQTVRRCLSSWITHLLTAMPLRARATFAELPCGCLISPEGCVTRSISIITRGRCCTTYYRLLERGSVRTLRLASALFEVVNGALPMEVLNGYRRHSGCTPIGEPWAASFGTITPGNNRPQFLLAQCWVTLGVRVTGSADRKYALPIVPRSVPPHRQSQQIDYCVDVVRSLTPVMMNKPVRQRYCFIKFSKELLDPYVQYCR
jgi:hypothetical protein